MLVNRCECAGCKKHDGHCLNLDGQCCLFSNDVIHVVRYEGQMLCDCCTPKPIVIGEARSYNKREEKRLSKQEALFLFY